MYMLCCNGLNFAKVGVVIMKKNMRPAVFILIGSMAFPIWAEEGLPAAPARQMGQPVATVPVAAQPAAIVPSASAQQPTALNKSRLTFMDSKLFDVKLGKELESGKDTVEVEVSGRVPLSNIPPRIDRWVVKSAEEGKVELLQSEPAPKTRFIFSLIPMVFNAFGAYKNMQEERMFDQAKRYDTKIYYKKDESGDTLIEKIVLTKRKP